MTSKVVYKGGLRSVCTHIKSGREIITDAPVDNYGKGEAFSPTDLTATSLGTCMVTVMGILADRNNIVLEGTTVEVTKQMADSPRRIAAIFANVMFPKGLTLNDKQKAMLENTAINCPVAKSLHPDIKLDINFIYC